MHTPHAYTARRTRVTINSAHAVVATGATKTLTIISPCMAARLFTASQMMGQEDGN